LSAFNKISLSRARYALWSAFFAEIGHHRMKMGWLSKFS